MFKASSILVVSDVRAQEPSIIDCSIVWEGLPPRIAIVLLLNLWMRGQWFS